MRKIGTVLLTMSVLLGTVQLCSAQRRPKDRILDRKVFVITMELQGKKKKKKETEPIKSELSFRSNKIGDTYMRHPDNWGFQKGEYGIYEKEKVLDEMRYKFEGINKNSRNMSLKWKGAIFGDKIEGTATVSKKGKVKAEYTFSGTLKQKRKR